MFPHCIVPGLHVLTALFSHGRKVPGLHVLTALFSHGRKVPGLHVLTALFSHGRKVPGLYILTNYGTGVRVRVSGNIGRREHRHVSICYTMCILLDCLDVYSGFDCLLLTVYMYYYYYYYFYCYYYYYYNYFYYLLVGALSPVNHRGLHQG